MLAIDGNLLIRYKSGLEKVYTSHVSVLRAIEKQLFYSWFTIQSP